MIESKWNGDTGKAKFSLSGREIIVGFESFNDYFTFINELEKQHADAIRLGEDAMCGKIKKHLER